MTIKQEIERLEDIVQGYKDRLLVIEQKLTSGITEDLLRERTLLNTECIRKRKMINNLRSSKKTPMLGYSDGFNIEIIQQQR